MNYCYSNYRYFLGKLSVWFDLWSFTNYRESTVIYAHNFSARFSLTFKAIKLTIAKKLFEKSA